MDGVDKHIIGNGEATVNAPATNWPSPNISEAGPLRDALAELYKLVCELVTWFPIERAEVVGQNFQALLNEATAEAPNKAWVEVSAQGLIEAAKRVESLTEPVTKAVETVVRLALD